MEEETQKPKNPNIVKKIFDRPRTGGKISSIFTHSRPTAEKGAPKKSVKSVASGLRPLTPAFDIGTSSIKLIQLAKGKTGDTHALVMDHEDYTSTSNATTTSDIRDALQKIIQRNFIKDKVVLGVSIRELQTYNLVFPQMAETELHKAVRFKLAQLKPFGQTDIQKIHYWMYPWKSGVPKPGTPAPKRLMIACATQESVAKKENLLTEMGLKICRREPGPMSVVHLSDLAPTPIAQQGVTLWLDFGRDESTLLVELNGSAIYLRKLTVSSQQLTKQIAQQMNANEAQAESLKRRHGLSYWSSAAEAKLPPGQATLPGDPKNEASGVYLACSSTLENLIIDIEHSFKYFSYQISRSEITRFDRIVLAGHGAELKKLDEFIKSRLDVPVVRVNPFQHLQIPEKFHREKKAMLEAAPGYCVAVGLAGLSLAESVSIGASSTMSTQQRIAHWTKALNRLPVKVGIGVVLLAMLGMGSEFAALAYYKGRADALKREIRSAQLSLGRFEAQELSLSEDEAVLLENQLELEAKFETLQKSRNTARRFSAILRRLAKILPEEIWITKLFYGEDKLTIKGASARSRHVMSVIQSLEDSKDFIDVTFNYSEREPKAGFYEFEIVVRIGVVEGSEEIRKETTAGSSEA